MSLYSYHYHRPSYIKQINEQSLTGILIRSVAVLFSLFIFLLSSLLIRNIEADYASPVSAETQSNINLTMKQSSNELMILSPSPSPSPTTSPTSIIPPPSNETTTLPQGDVGQPTKKLYTVAIIGDSMVDTMGEVLEYLDTALKKKYPMTNFLLYNYGTGAQNIQDGLNRFGSHFKYQSRDYPSLPELKPDILIVASFSYNPFSPHDRDRHWLALTKLVQSAKTVSSNVYLLAEIAPLRADFGKGPQGVNWSNDSNFEHSGRILEQLENTVALADNLGVPLIDAFTPSLIPGLKEGKRIYVNPSDGIHPSVEGHKFIADKISQTIILP